MALFPHLNGSITASPRLRRWRSCRFLLICAAFVSAFSFLAFFGLYVMGDAPTELRPGSHHLRYATLRGYFAQDDPSTIGKDFDYAESNLGLIDRDYVTDHDFDPSKQKTQWQRFERYVESLNERASAGEQYKLLFLGRHGEGDHNVAQAQYGTEAWDCYWCKLDGDGTLYWSDARITAKGRAQVLVAHEFWRKSLVEAKIPAPQTYYSSPLDRCCETANVTFGGLDLPKDRPFRPVIKELVREALGVHTCDRRSTRAQIAQRWPDFAFEPGFPENDPLWVADLRESDAQIEARVRTALDDIFAHDPSTFISITSHSGAIAGFLRVLGHEEFGLQTGGVIAVLAKAERVLGRPPPTTIAPGVPPPTCTADPTSAGG